MMMSKTPIFIYNSFNHGYALGSAGCQIFALVGALSGIGAAITNACIAYDRLYKCKQNAEWRMGIGGSQVHVKCVCFFYRFSDIMLLPIHLREN